MSKKRAIPAIPTSDLQLYNVLASLKENMELLTGVRGGAPTELPANASLQDCISKINEIVKRLSP